MAASSEPQTTARQNYGQEIPKYNYVAENSIWKDHVWKEEEATNAWEHNWGFMRSDLRELVKEEFKDHLGKTRATEDHVGVRSVTPLETYVDVQPSPKPYPETTAHQVGWRSGVPECNLEKYGAYTTRKGNLYKNLKWPQEAL